MKIRFLWSCAFLLATAPSMTFADAFPAKSVRIIVPYATGGSADVLARQIAAGLQVTWKQAVVVDNVAGASGNIGSMEVVRANADGYTLLIQNSTVTGNLAVMGKLPYDLKKDLTPIMLLAETPLAVVANPNAHISNVQELVRASKEAPGTLSYGSCGIGTPQHFTMEMLKQKTGVVATHIPYKGCSPALTDVLGGHVQLAVVTANLVLPYVKSGQLKVIGVSTAKRYSQLPDVPTLQEQGLGSFDIANWSGLMAPARLPPDAVRQIEEAVTKVLANPSTAASLTSAGVEPQLGSGAVLAKVIADDTVRYAALVKSAGIKPE